MDRFQLTVVWLNLQAVMVEEVAEQVAQEKLQEDLAIPDFPSLPE